MFPRPPEIASRPGANETRIAGVIEKASTAKRAMSEAAVSVRAFKSSPWRYGMFASILAGMRSASRCIVQRDIRRPSSPPATTSTVASVTNWPMRREREAPSAPRTASSRFRASERTSSRLTTFTQAINSSSAAPREQRQQNRRKVAEDDFRESFDARALSAIRVGILPFQLMRDGRHL